MRQLLHFQCRGNWFKVNEKGLMTQERNNDFAGNWRFLGVSFHHWRMGIDVQFSPEITAPEIIGGLVWDLDHGTTRQWAGSYYGKLPRITGAYWENIH